MSDLNILWHMIEKGRKGDNLGTSTGLSKLDKLIGGIQSSRYYVISAASSVGKTAYVLFMMYNILKNITPDKPIYFLYFSLEISSEILLAKLMGLYCAEEFGIYLTVNDIMSFEKPLDDYKYECLQKAKKWLESISQYLTILDAGLNANVLYRETIKFAEEHGDYETIDGKSKYIPNNPKQKLIGVIDHLSLSQPKEGRSLKEEMDLESSYMVTIKRKYLMSFFVLMQQNRESSSMDRRKADLSEPGLNDVRDSSGPIQDADVVLQLFFPFREKLTSYRDYKILGNDGMKQYFRSCIISKNRYGIANQVIGMAFYGSVGWWNELKPGKDITDFTQYCDESTNIPCKLNKKINKQTEDLDVKDSNQSKSEKKELILKF